MIKRIYILIFVFALLWTTGCASNAPSNYPTGNGSDSFVSPSLELFHHEVANFDVLFADVGKAKFIEYSSDYNGRHDLKQIDELYIPFAVQEKLSLSEMSAIHGIDIGFYYEDDIGTVATFSWHRAIHPSGITSNLQGRGEILYNELTINSIKYCISQWNQNTHSIFWAQEGKSFSAWFTGDFTEADMLAFCDAQSITAWELDGDAVSVSIQGMNNVSIHDSDYNTITADDDVLYRTKDSGDKERIGYKWLIDEDTARYQYVLEPGIYEFNATGVSGKPELLVKHFDSGEAISSVDYSKEITDQSASQFTLTVTPDPNETDLDIKSAHNFTVSMQTTKTSYSTGEAVNVDVMLVGDTSFALAESKIAYDTNLLEYAGYGDLSGWMSQVYREPPNLVTFRNVPHINMNIGALCINPIKLITLIFKVKDTLPEDEVETDLSFAAANVYPTTDIITTTTPGEALTLTLYI